jgi:hypothetical protein
MKNMLSVSINRYNGIAFSLVAFVVLLGSCGKTNTDNTANIPENTINYVGTFRKTDSTITAANGSVMAVFNKTTSQLSYTITWHSLSSNPIAMHFHDNGPVIVSITGYPVSTDQSFSGIANFSTTQANDLALGYIFVMIHTANFPSGEIIAPLVVKQ